MAAKRKLSGMTWGGKEWVRMIQRNIEIKYIISSTMQWYLNIPPPSLHPLTIRLVKLMKQFAVLLFLNKKCVEQELNRRRAQRQTGKSSWINCSLKKNAPTSLKRSETFCFYMLKDYWEENATMTEPLTRTIASLSWDCFEICIQNL